MTSGQLFGALPAVFVISVALTGCARRMALRVGMIDLVNERSSHATPRPRGGGAALVVATSALLVALAVAGELSARICAVLGAGALVVALLGLADDWRQLSTRVRLGVHFLAAVWAVVLLDGMPAVRVGDHFISLGWFGYVFGALGIVWMLNLFNFMDGIDGLAASEAAFIGIAGVLILEPPGPTSGVAALGLGLGAACLGFLVWNWPPARIFMGDAGSGYLGYFIACFALLAGHSNPVALPVFLILGGVFIVDATVTFIRRIARHERYDVGHRTHGYQRLARRWGHRRVTVGILLVNLLLLLPAAMFAAARPPWAAAIAAAVMCVLLAGALLVGCGRREPPEG